MNNDKLSERIEMYRSRGEDYDTAIEWARQDLAYQALRAERPCRCETCACTSVREENKTRCWWCLKH